MRQRARQRLVQKLVAQAPVEALAEGVLLRLAGLNVLPADAAFIGARIAFEVSSAPLFDVMAPAGRAKQ
jgi:hypothetical protein